MKDKYKSYSYTLIIAFLLLSVCNMSAQTKLNVTGVITSETDGLPLVGATIVEKDKDNRIINAVVADFDGNYSIMVSNAKATLAYSYVGFNTKEIVLGDARVLDIQLSENISELDDVVIKIRPKIFTGVFNIEARRVATAIETVNMTELAETVSGGITDQLQGRLSGVDITASSGDPGAGMSIRIRGTSSLNASSEPLIVINGVPFETEIDDAFDFGSADEEQYASMIGVSPDDIEEISVLKDAAATAQYGSRAANGVLLITTKRGTQGKAIFSYSYKGTVGWQPKGIPMLNGDQYSTLIKEENLDANIRTEFPQIEYNPNYESYNLYNKNVNWIDEITQLGETKEHFLSVSGGGEKSTYRVSGGYKNQVGTTVGTGLKNFNARAILDYHISDKLSIASELSYSHNLLDRSFISKIDGRNVGIRELALIKMPNQSIYELDEFGNPMDSYFTPEDAFQGNGATYYNPVAMANLSSYRIEKNRIIPTFRINYSPISSLSFRSIISFDVNVEKTNRFLPEEAVGTAWTSSAANASTYVDSEFFVMRTDNSLTWHPQLGEKHSLFALIKAETYEKTSKGYGVATSNSPSSNLQSSIVPARVEGGGGSIASSFSQSRSLGFNFMFNYQYLDRYILSGGIRSEGNSKFGANYRYGVFPSLAGKWIFSDEKFMEPLEDYVDELSLRASYGVNGISPNINYGQYNTYSTYNYNYLDERPVYPNSMELVDLRWETVVQKNLGLTYILFDNRISGDLEYYTKETRDLLNKNTFIPSTTGFTSVPYLNLGNVMNKGFELNIKTKIINKKNFKFSMDFNFSRNTNVITKITEAQDVEDGNPLATGEDSYLKRIQVGNPIGSFYGYRYKGVYSTSDDTFALDENDEIIYDINGVPKQMTFSNSREFRAGEARYEDINKDGTIDRLDVVYLGNANPLLYGGFGPTFEFKNFRFNFFFNYRLKQKVINIARMNTESMDDYDNQSTAVLRRWRFEGDVTDIPKASLGNQVNTLPSDRFLEDASFIRLKYVTLRYNLPSNFVKKLNFTKASLYVTGNNLLTFTKYTGADPETGNSSDWKKIGYDRNQTPQSKQVTVGLNLSF
ncbi:SusC/RagA family TonB-linked outer membrane protein [Flavicella sediminum]|uniref:SusC/RagA family TonB-linked outer membrane protein n=1 Tax=Flavicella sediminum TaxID=2585141 RepID=UPI00111FEE0E|nr:SusC/RagA family TonB-linked outer membrane protein [Flavicella sediminum]